MRACAGQPLAGATPAPTFSTRSINVRYSRYESARRTLQRSQSRRHARTTQRLDRPSGGGASIEQGVEESPNNAEDYISLTMYCGWEAEPGPGSRQNGRTGTAQCAQVSPVTEASPSMGCTRAWGLDPVSAGAYGVAATKSMGGPLKSETSRPATVVAIAVPF